MPSIAFFIHGVIKECFHTLEKTPDFRDKLYVKYTEIIEVEVKTT